MRESLSSELERSVQENSRLREELLSSRERERLSLNIQMDMGVAGQLGDATLGNVTGNKPGLYGDADKGQLDEECELDSGTNSEQEQTTPGEGDEGNTLLFELDMQYRVLIEKYEALLEARRRDFEAEDATNAAIMSASMHSQATSEDCCEDSSASGITSTSGADQRDASCQTDVQVIKKRNNNHSGNAPNNGGHHHNSSRRFVSLATEPAFSTNCTNKHLLVQPSATGNKSASAGFSLEQLSAADQETFNRHFEHSPPEYKKLFAEIFAVLKRKVAEIPLTCAAEPRQPTPLLQDLESRLECNLEKLKATVPPHVRFTRSYAEVVRARQQQAQQIRAQAQRNMMLNAARNQQQPY